MSTVTSVDKYAALQQAESYVRRALFALSNVGYNTARLSEVLRDIASLMAELHKEAIVNLQCCCCGSSMRGRQWWNRDTGYGMCMTCIRSVRARGMSEEEIKNNYGHEGIHWGVIEKWVEHP